MQADKSTWIAHFCIQQLSVPSSVAANLHQPLFTLCNGLLKIL